MPRVRNRDQAELIGCSLIPIPRRLRRNPDFVNEALLTFLLNHAYWPRLWSPSARLMLGSHHTLEFGACTPAQPQPQHSPCMPSAGCQHLLMLVTLQLSLQPPNFAPRQQQSAGSSLGSSVHHPAFRASASLTAAGFTTLARPLLHRLLVVYTQIQSLQSVLRTLSQHSHFIGPRQQATAVRMQLQWRRSLLPAGWSARQHFVTLLPYPLCWISRTQLSMLLPLLLGIGQQLRCAANFLTHTHWPMSFFSRRLSNCIPITL